MGSPKTCAFLGLYSPPVFMESLKNQGFLRLITKRCENIFILILQFTRKNQIGIAAVGVLFRRLDYHAH